MAERTGYKIVVYLDDNPLSPTYMQTYEERTLDESTCPIPQDDLVLVSNECEVDESGYTGYRLEIYYNRTTGEYTEIRAEDPECIESSTDEQWVNSGSPYCETTDKGINTGYMLQLQVQMNPNLENYGETRNQRYKSPDCGGNDCAIWDDIQKQCHVAVIDCVATFDGTEDVNQIDINPLSATYNQTRTINKESNNCENCTDTFFSWIDVGTMCGDDDFLCGNGLQRVATNSYIVSQKYKMIGEKPPVPMDEYQIFLKIEDDEDCGYIRPQYGWQKAEGQYLCDYETYIKYEMYVKIVSYDAGITWSVVEPLETQRGEVISEDSYDCGKPMYRWVDNGEVVCEDNGDDGKIRYYSAFSNGEFSNLTSSVSCNENDTLTAAEVKSVTQTRYRRVGDCVRVIDESANVANGGYVSTPVVWLGDYTEDVGNITGYSGSCIDIPERVEKINTISRNAYFENIVMMPPHPISATSVFQGGSGLEDYCAIWVGADNYNQWANDAFWGNFDGRDNRTAKLLPMNNDTISWKARIHLKSNFNDWYYFIPDGEDETTITSEEGRYGRVLMTEIKLSDKIKTLTRNSFGSNNNGYRDFENLIAIDFGHGIERIGSYVFQNIKMESIHIPESVIEIDYGAFMNNKLTSITFDNGVETIGESAFNGCKCSAITIPDSVKTIGSTAFYTNNFTVNRFEIGSGCTSLGSSVVNRVNTVVMKALTPPNLSKYTFGYNNPNEILVPCELYDRYREALSGNTGYTSVLSPYDCSGEEVAIAVLYLNDGSTIEIKRDRKQLTKTLFGSEVNSYFGSISAITITSECNRINGMKSYDGGQIPITFEGITPPELVSVSVNFSEINVPCVALFNYYDADYFCDHIELIQPNTYDCVEETWVNDFDCENRYTKYYTINGETRSTNISSGYCADIDQGDFIQEDEVTFKSPLGQNANMSITFIDCGTVGVRINIHNGGNLSYYINNHFAGGISCVYDCSNTLNLDSGKTCTLVFKTGGTADSYVEIIIQ